MHHEFTPKQVARFWARVDQSGECWEWIAYRNHDGYGRLVIGSRTDGTRRLAMAHRVAWEIAKGPIPDELRVLHRCDNPPCCRPEHLFLGTQADNIADCRQKGRTIVGYLRGEKHGRAKLTDDQALWVRRRYADGDVTQLQLANLLGVAEATVHRIVLGRGWRHLPADPR